MVSDIQKCQNYFTIEYVRLYDDFYLTFVAAIGSNAASS